MGGGSDRVRRIVEEINRRTSKEYYRIVLNEEREPALTGSKVGGIPYWREGMDYPVDAHGNKMMMLMQVNCAEAGLKSPLPQQGMLQWFISVDPELMFGCRGNYDEKGDGFCIIYHDDITVPPVSLDVPTQANFDDMLTPVKREVAIDVEAGQTTMGVNDGHFNRLFFDIVKEITGTDHQDEMWWEYLDNDDCLYLEQNMGMKRPCHQMTGYPVYSQDEARRDIELHDTLLFQLDSQFSVLDHSTALVMWGDMGSGFVFINHDDLAALDFSHAYYCWDCG